jgi:hypothetical protein
VAEEAILRVILEGQGGQTPRSPAGSRPDRPEPSPVHEKPEPAGRPAFKPQTIYEQLLGIAEKFRGTLGGVLGPLAGAALDLAKAFRETEAASRGAAGGMRSQKEPTGGRDIASQLIPEALPVGPQASVNPNAAAGERALGKFGVRQPRQSQPFVPRKSSEVTETPSAIPLSKGQIPATMEVGVSEEAIAGIGTGAGGMGAALGAAGAAAGIVVAVIAATKAIRAMGEGAIKAGGDLVAGLTSAKVGAADFAAGVGAGAKKAADALVYISPAAAIVVGAFGQVAESGAAVMRQFDAMATRFTGFGPGVAAAFGQAAVTHIMGEFRRGQEVGPSLARYIQARTEVQEKFEDIKARFLVQITPAVLTGLKILERMMPAIEVIAQVTGFELDMLAAILDPLDWIRQKMGAQDKMPVNIAPGQQIADAINKFRKTPEF